MTVLALYVPKPHEFTTSVLGLAIMYLVFCAIAYRLKLSLTVAAISMVLGAAIALAPDVLPLWNTDLGDYGDMAREWSSTNYSDTFFAVTYYLEVGRGKLVAVGGMAAALILHLIVHAFANRKPQTGNAPKPSVDADLKSMES